MSVINDGALNSNSFSCHKIDTERLKAGGANSLAAAVTLKQQFSLSSLTSQLGPSAECMIQQKKTSPAAGSAKVKRVDRFSFVAISVVFLYTDRLSCFLRSSFRVQSEL